MTDDDNDLREQIDKDPVLKKLFVDSCKRDNALAKQIKDIFSNLHKEFYRKHEGYLTTFNFWAKRIEKIEDKLAKLEKNNDQKTT
jgi:hypothetical protein